MARIRDYDSQIRASGAINSSASPEDFGYGVGVGLQNVGQGVAELGGALYRQQENDELSDAQRSVAEARLRWTQDWEKRQLTAKPGDRTVADTLRADMGAFFEQEVGNYKTKRAQQYVAQHGLDLTTQFTQHAIGFQSRMAVEKLKLDHTASVKSLGDTLLQDPLQYGSAKAQITSDIQGRVGKYDLGDEMTNAQLKTQAEQELAWFAGQGALRRTGGAAAVVRTMGIDPTAKKGGAVPGWKGFDTAVSDIIKFEGGFTPKDGASGAPANFGINQRANPDVDVKNLTKAQAVELYRTRYWDAIGGDNLPPATALVAFDMAVNQGVGSARAMLEQTGGDPMQMIAERRKFYEGLAKNPKQTENLTGWLNRMDALEGKVRSMSNSPILTELPSDMAQGATAFEWFNDMNPENKLRFLQAAQSQYQQEMSQARAGLKLTVDDHKTQVFAVGYVQNKVSPQQFLDAYGPEEGARQYREYSGWIKAGESAQAALSLPPEQQQGMFTNLMPKPGEEGYAEKYQQFELTRKVIAEGNKAFVADPVGTSVLRQTKGITEVMDGDTTKLAAELPKRLPALQTIGQRLGRPVALSAREAAVEQSKVQRMSFNEKASYFETMRTAIADPQIYNAFVNQVAPDSPATSTAAKLIGLSGAKQTERGGIISPDVIYSSKMVAERILQGEAFLRKTPGENKQDGTGSARGSVLPDNEKMWKVFAAETDKAFAGRPEAELNAAYEAVKAYYVGDMIAVGNIKGDLDEPKFQAAVARVLGKPVATGDTKVFIPWGWNESQFRDAAKQRYDALGLKTPFSSASFVLIGDKRYGLKTGLGVMTDATGKPVEIDLSK